jgi:hypothetical protein
VSYQAAAAANAAWVAANSRWYGQAEAIATLIRRTLIRTNAPILSSLSRFVPRVAAANCVSAKPMRRNAHSIT